MPLASEAPRPPGLVFDSSVVAELLFLLKSIGHPGPQDPCPSMAGVNHGAGVPADLGRRVVEFWGTEMPFWELLVVAHEAGVLVGPLAASQIEAKLGAACDSVPLDPLLRSEPDADREEIRARLRLLHHDEALRRRYLRLVAEVWELFERDWTAGQLPVISRVVDDCRAKERRGLPWRSALKGTEEPACLDAGWERARQSGSALVAICAYGGSLVIDLPDLQFFAMTMKDRRASDRERAGELARRLRSIADPTRLALVELLACQPRTVGELAVELGVSQPTVSNHMKVLRESGLLRGADSTGDRRNLAVDTEELSRLFREVEALVRGS
ncbi:MAG: ArsR/SmtB family transcription factor [Acidimicrobiales bacterium]|jgi:DNA-binding transcriptional ArsR family regulator